MHAMRNVRERDMREMRRPAGGRYASTRRWRAGPDLKVPE